MKKLQTPSTWFGPFEQVEVTDDSYICDGCVMPFNVIGEAEVVDYDPAIDLRPLSEEEEAAIKQSAKLHASELLAETDWTEIPSVSDSASDLYLTNKDEFVLYRNALRTIAVNPTVSPIWPTKPKAIWS